jgi:hypothetical protein
MIKTSVDGTGADSRNCVARGEVSRREDRRAEVQLASC